MVGLQFGKRAIEDGSPKTNLKGFRNCTFSPDGKYVVSAMQENTLHGWE